MSQGNRTESKTLQFDGGHCPQGITTKGKMARRAKAVKPPVDPDEALIRAHQEIKSLKDALAKVVDELKWEREMAFAARKGHEDSERTIASLTSQLREARTQAEHEIDTLNEEWLTKYNALQYKFQVG
jgi:hypothetical protein